MKLLINGKKQEIKLPVHFKNRWVKALRSGNYEQCQSSLYDGNGYCCLGVAGAICGVPKERMDSTGLLVEDHISFQEVKKIPKLLRGETSKQEPDYNELVEILTEMNDKGKSFKYIASYIERYL